MARVLTVHEQLVNLLDQLHAGHLNVKRLHSGGSNLHGESEVLEKIVKLFIVQKVKGYANLDKDNLLVSLAVVTIILILSILLFIFLIFLRINCNNNIPMLVMVLPLWLRSPLFQSPRQKKPCLNFLFEKFSFIVLKDLTVKMFSGFRS